MIAPLRSVDSSGIYSIQPGYCIYYQGGVKMAAMTPSAAPAAARPKPDGAAGGRLRLTSTALHQISILRPLYLSGIAASVPKKACLDMSGE
jgi:hypothetical protein